jgi:hypothetical protein
MDLIYFLIIMFFVIVIGLFIIFVILDLMGINL